MSLEYEPASEPPHNFVKSLNRAKTALHASLCPTKPLDVTGVEPDPSLPPFLPPCLPLSCSLSLSLSLSLETNVRLSVDVEKRFPPKRKKWKIPQKLTDMGGFPLLLDCRSGTENEGPHPGAHRYKSREWGLLQAKVERLSTVGNSGLLTGVKPD